MHILYYQVMKLTTLEERALKTVNFRCACSNMVFPGTGRPDVLFFQ